MHVAVTGASSGIGEAIAREMARAGAKLTLVARRRELLEKLATEVGGGALAVAHDLSDSTRATAWMADAEKMHGPIDVLVNNAGVENTGPAALVDADAGERLLATNLLSPVRMARQLLPAMIARGNGVIVNVTSVAALTPAPLQAWYGASKAGLAAFSEALGGELRGTGVHVLTVYPGPVTTAMSEAGYAAFGGKKGAVALLPEGRPEELARRIRRAIARRQRRIVYPRFYVGARWFPWLGRALADAFVKSPYLPAASPRRSPEGFGSP
jgi:short-subunit dehydrogenase